MQVIKNQVIATTHVDSQGDKLTPEGLHDMKRQIPDPHIMCQGHDLTKPPSGKLFNIRIQETSDGELALVGDMEVWDDQLEVHLGGMSFAFTANAADGPTVETPDVDILVNPRLIPTSIVEQVLVRPLQGKSPKLRLMLLHQKALEEVAILIIAFAGAHVATGFFRKAGSDLWDVFKKQLSELSKRFSDEKQGALAFHCTYSYERDNHTVKVIVALDRNDVELLRKQPVDIDQVHRFLEDTLGNSCIMKVVVKLKTEEPYWEIVQIVDVEGKLIDL